ncbi:MAG: Fic family protein [Ferruginibacter sp.]|nr:Fic family protein [Ferruginibacter sp.]
MNYKFNILTNKLFPNFCEIVLKKNLNDFFLLEESELTISTFSFYTSVSAVFSSKIEGEDIDLDSYIKHKRFGIKYLPDYTCKIDDLYNAYQFAKNTRCNKKSIEKAHQILTKNILPKNKQGKERKSNMYVASTDGRIEYVAASPFLVNKEMNKFYKDLEFLISAELTIQQVFYYASLLHLVFVKIHPFDDGNGRTGRLLEKWFLAEKLGENAWLIESEKNYYQQHQLYYKNLRLLGLDYEDLNYQNAIPFLLMLPQSLILDKE